MKHSMMRVAVAATLGFSALAANAGTIGVNVGATLAAEYIQAATTIVIPVITFQTQNLINDGATVYFHVRFSAGTTTAPTTAPKIYLNNTDVSASHIITLGAVDADGLGYTVSVKAGTGGLASGAIVNFGTSTAPTAGTNGSLTALDTTLGAGTAVTTSVGYTTTAGDFKTVSTWVESPVTATLLQSKKALSQTTVNSNVVTTGFGYVAATTETAKVDVGTSLTKFTSSPATGSTTKINLGAVKLSVAALATPAAGTAAATDFGNVTLKATGDFSVAGASVALNPDAACAAAPTAAGTISTDGKSATFAAVTTTVATSPMYLCYTIPGTKTVPYGVQYAIGGASVIGNATTTASTQTGGNVYLLNSNGASVVVPSFVPSTGTAGNGYNTYLRVINTGNLTTAVNVAAYNSTTGVVGTASTLVASLPAGASAMLDTNTVATALGLTANSWNALLVTGITNQLAVQPLLVNPQGVITNLSSINGGNNSAASN